MPLCLLALVAIPTQKTHPVLAGNWRLDSTRTEQPRWTGSSATVQRNDLGTRGMYDAPTRGREPPLDAEALMRILRPILQLRIQHTDSTVSISDGTGALATYRTDGKKIKEPQLTGDDLEISAKWKDGQLTIERKVPDLATIRETYFVDPSSTKLIVDVRLSGNRLPRNIELRRVYDPTH